MIERGDADCMLAGGSEMATSPTGLARIRIRPRAFDAQ